LFTDRPARYDWPYNIDHMSPPEGAPPGLWDIQNTVRETWCLLSTHWVRMCHVLFSDLYSHALAHRMCANGCIPRRQQEAVENEKTRCDTSSISEPLNLGKKYPCFQSTISGINERTSDLKRFLAFSVASITSS